MATMLNDILEMPIDVFKADGGCYQIGNEIVHFLFEPERPGVLRGKVNAYADFGDKKHLVASWADELHINFDQYVTEYANGREVIPIDEDSECFVSSWRISDSEQGLLFKADSPTGIEMNHCYIMVDGEKEMKLYISFPQSRLEELLERNYSYGNCEINIGEEVILRFIKIF